MGLSFKRREPTGKQVSTTSSAIEGLTSDNIRFLQEIGLKLINNGNIGYSAGSDIRRNPMGKGISYAQPLRFVKIEQ